MRLEKGPWVTSRHHPLSFAVAHNRTWISQLKQKTMAYLPFLPQSLKLNVPKGISGKFLGVFFVIPFLTLVDLGAFNVLALGIATLAHVFPERNDIDRKEQISLNLPKDFITFLKINHTA